MAAIVASTVTRSDAAPLRWQCAATEAGAAANPLQLNSALSWLPAAVPGTVAGALADARQFDIDAPPKLTDRDYWYRTDIAGHGRRHLRLHGLATLAEVWLDDTLLLRSDNMFVRHDLTIVLSGTHTLAICFRALDSYIPPPSRRARWRPAMIPRRSLRSLRTSLLGHMPGWCPEIPIVGPWRPIELADPQTCFVESRSLQATFTRDGDGFLDARVTLCGPLPDRAVLECGGSCSALEQHDSVWKTRLQVRGVDPWWPHTHGQPTLYTVSLRLIHGQHEQCVHLGNVGFRRIQIEHGADGAGFALNINDTAIFCRGANWISADPVRAAASREALLPWIERMRDAHMNMVRIGGTTVYEVPAFYELCDEHGILVWQDCMLANFDYPEDDANFRRSVETEVRQFLERTSASPCLAVLCGGSEVAQQASMLGLARDRWTGPLFDEWLPAIVHELRPDVAYLPNTPFGEPLPFVAAAGVTHYYGVGAYRRPLQDARLSQVRFASECLGFANIPEPITLRTHLPDLSASTADWKRRTPRDLGASWDFEDVRDHYLEQLFAIEAESLRRDDPDRYLTLSRATSAEMMEATIGEWRRAASVCAGALVWTLQDLWPGAGWGVLDSTGEPKSAWYALRRAFRPIQVVLTDEGLNGLAIHCINDDSTPLTARLEFACYRASHSLVSGAVNVELEPRQSRSLSAFELLGTFFDVSYSYRFGAPAHDVSVASLFDARSNRLLAHAFHFAQGRQAVRAIDDLSLQLDQSDGRWFLSVSAQGAAVCVHIDSLHHRPADNWFHLAPAQVRSIELSARSAQSPPPEGSVRAINCAHAVRFGGLQ